MNRTYTKPYLGEVDVISVGIPGWLKQLLLALHLIHNFTVQDTNGTITIGKVYQVKPNMRMSVSFWLKDPSHEQFAAECARMDKVVKEKSLAQGQYESRFNQYEEVVRWKGHRYWAFFAVPK